MKYLLLEHWTDLSGVYPRISIFDNPGDRETGTIEAIYGTHDVDEDHHEEWVRYLRELRDTGSIAFEGDPGLSWMQCEDLVLPGRTPLAYDVTAAWVGAMMACYLHSGRDRNMLRTAAREAGLVPLKLADRLALVAMIGEDRTNEFENLCLPS